MSKQITKILCFRVKRGPLHSFCVVNRNEWSLVSRCICDTLSHISSNLAAVLQKDDENALVLIRWYLVAESLTIVKFSYYFKLCWVLLQMCFGISLHFAGWFCFSCFQFILRFCKIWFIMFFRNYQIKLRPDRRKPFPKVLSNLWR